MATSFVDAAIGDLSGGTTTDVVFSGTPTDGDILVCAVSINNAGTITAPSGFAQKGTNIDSGGRLAVYWKRAASEGSATYTWTVSASSYGDVMGIRIRGALASGDPWSSTTPTTDTDGGGGTLDPASINADGSGSVAIAFARRDTGLDWTAPSGWTEPTNGDGQASETIYKLLAGGGASGSPAFSSTDFAAGAAWLGIIEQAGGGATKGKPFRKSGTRTWIRRY